MSLTIDYLIPFLRMRLGDTNPDTYRYEDEWLINALIFGVKLSGRYWYNRYTINDDGVLNIALDGRDEPVIVLLAAIMMMEGSLENTAYSLTSWKDAEISFSNLESGRIKDNNINRLYKELDALILPPTKRLARTIKGNLPGYSPSGALGYEKINEI